MNTRAKTAILRNPRDTYHLILAVLIPLVAFCLQSLFWAAIEPCVWFLFFPAVFFSSWVGGLRGGLVATALSTGLAWYFFIPPQFSFAVPSPTAFVSIGMFVGIGVLFSLTHGRLQKANRSAIEALAAVRSANDALADFKAALDEHAIVAITDAHGKITYVNDKFCVISKYPREELVGRDHRIINSGHHPKAFIRGMWETIGSGRVWKGEIKNRAKDGTFYWVDTSIVPFLGDDGKPIQFIAIRADITERKQAEEKIVQLNADLQNHALQLEEANRELESFSYSVSHDLRAPLRHVQGYAEMLTKALPEGQLAGKPRRFLQTITDASVEMGQLIDDLLAFSRMAKVELRETQTPLDELVRETLRGLEGATKDRNIVWKIAPLPDVIGDAAVLRQVFANLVGNAVKYTRGRNPAQIEIGCAGEEDGRTVVFVRDNGVGYDPRYAHKLFGVFQRLHRPEEFEGTGIGLAIVRRIIVRHGGRVWADGRPGEGATFYFTLQPATSAAKERKEHKG